MQQGPPNHCFKGGFHLYDHFHKDTPSPEEENFPECTSWKNLSCYTFHLVNEISLVGTHLGLYNISYDLCNRLSVECVKYLKVFWKVNVIVSDHSLIIIIEINQCLINSSSCIELN